MKKRPVIDVPFTTADRLFNWLSAALQVAMIMILALHFRDLADGVPMRYDLAGNVTKTASPAILLILIFFSLKTWGLITLLARYPHTHNYPVPVTEHNAHYLYQTSKSVLSQAKLMISLLFFYILWTSVQIGLGRAERDHPLILWGLIAALFAVVGWGILRMRNVPSGTITN